MLQEEIVFGHTVFELKVYQKSVYSQLYLVSACPYHFDTDLYEDQFDKVYKGNPILYLHTIT